METQREGGKKRKERNNKELLFTTCSSLEKFQEKQLERWKLSYLERMRRCSKRQSPALTVKTHQQINDSREHVPSKHTRKIKTVTDTYRQNTQDKKSQEHVPTKYNSKQTSQGHVPSKHTSK